jgi:sporulation and spore germination protein
VIPRHHTVLFVILLVASIAMGGELWHLRERAHQRMLAGQDNATPTKAPQVAPAVPATLMVAKDADDSLLPQEQSLPLPEESGARARVILGKLLDLYAAPGSGHPVPGGTSSIAQVFLLPAGSKSATGPQMAVVNLTASFAASHPSGIETESLTVLSICGTIHANLPRVTEVRFLVDGQVRPTLAGHADLTRTYLATDAAPAVDAHP